MRAVSAGLACLLLTGSGREAAAQGSASNEYQLKAAFLYHFAQFVEWPPETYKDGTSPLTYCTLGGDPFEGGLEASLNGKTIMSRPIRVLHLKEASEGRGCQVVFLGVADKKAVSATLAQLNGTPALTVGESANFAQAGGMIGFLLEDNKVRFEINVGVAEKARLKISARLLALAKTVIGTPKGT